MSLLFKVNMQNSAMTVRRTMSVVHTVGSFFKTVTRPVAASAEQGQRSADVGRTRGEPQVKGDPYSPWIRVGPVSPCPAKQHTTVNTYFEEVFKKYSNQKCFGSRRVISERSVQDGERVQSKKLLEPNFTWWTYEEVNARINHLMSGFKKIGVKPRDVVTIYMETRLEWMLAFFALNRLGAVVATMYSTLGDEELIYGMNLVESNVVVTSSDLLPKLVNNLNNLTHIKTIVYVESVTGQAGQCVAQLKTHTALKLEHLEKVGQKCSNVNSVQYRAKPDDDVLIMFTSGSTGRPKGVVIDHRGLLASQIAMFSGKDRSISDERFIGFLPLAHILELTGELTVIANGAPIGYSSPFTLTDVSPGLEAGCQGDATLLKPNYMPAVPLLLNRVQRSVIDKVALRGDAFVKLFDYAIRCKRYPANKRLRTLLFDQLIFRKIRTVLGGEMQHIYVGGAPLASDTHAFIESCLNVKVIPAYGASETVGPVVGSLLDDIKIGRVGIPLEGVYVKLIPWEEGGYYPTDKPNPRGEILIGGNCLAKGYYKNEEETRKAFFEENGIRWFRTRDIGEIFPDGTLKICDRANDLIKLANGEYVSLGKIEAILSTNEYVESICVYGNSLFNHLVALICPNLKNLAAIVNSESLCTLKTLDEFLKSDLLTKKVLQSLVQTGRTAGLSEHEIPKEIRLCSDEWSPSNGLLTSAMKIRRNQIYARYSTVIESLYQ